jgi:hypothetical protein
VLEQAGFEVVGVLPERLDFPFVDPAASCDTNLRAAGHEQTGTLTPEEQTQLRRIYFAALREAEEADPVAFLRADVLLAIGRANRRL